MDDFNGYPVGLYVLPAPNSKSPDVYTETGGTVVTWEVERDNGERKNSRGRNRRIQVT